MKFDIVIGNPPYNRGIDIDFINYAYKLSSKYVIMITPAKWQTAEADQKIASVMSYGEFRKQLVPHMSHVIFYPCCKDVFDILQVDGITYFLIDKDIHTRCIIENKSKHIKEFNSIDNRPISNSETLFNIGDEIIRYLGDYKHFKFKSINLNKKFRVWTNTQVPGGGLSTLECPRQTHFVGVSYIEEDVGIDIEHSNSSTCSFSSDSKQECEYFISWLNSKFTRFFVAINISKLTGIICDNCFRFVPTPPPDANGHKYDHPDFKFGHIYTDQELYEVFNLPQKYIDIIESIVKSRNSINSEG